MFVIASFISCTLFLAACSATDTGTLANPSLNAPTVLVPSALNCNRTLTGGTTPNIPTLSIDALYQCRPEARTTINAIQHNGPFSYDQDDTIFTNREAIMPALAKGAYHEYTVITPGASTRGTRRILSAGAPNRRPADFDKLYYTDDHYQTVWLLTNR